MRQNESRSGGASPIRGTFHVGTSGFAYDEWKGPFYPADLPAKRMLAFYASRFSSVEVNYTFRRLPSPKTLATWCAETPAGFVFAVKAHQRITHVHRLENADEPLAAFFDAIAPLGERIGPVLFQCPPTLRFDETRLRAFLELLPADRRCAFEFRHPSWSEALPLLESHGVAWCVAETDEHEVSDDERIDGPFVYLRLRRSDHSKTNLAHWAMRIDRVLTKGRDVFCYFKHEDAGKGADFAATLAKEVAAVRGHAAT